MNCSKRKNGRSLSFITMKLYLAMGKGNYLFGVFGRYEETGRQSNHGMGSGAFPCPDRYGN